METIKTIMTRRSVRSFRSTPVTNEQLKILLEAAMNAPSAGDGRPWQFVVTTSREQLDALADGVDEGNAMFRQAQAAVLICLDESLEKFKGFGPQDCSCAAQNIQLAAHDLGLGTVWIAVVGIPPRMAGCRRIFGIPETIMPFALFPIGVPAEMPPSEYRYDSQKVRWDRW
ncbi:MAG: nitroreductase family protein [Kiritimatiellaceae bacterium]|nr:nitroreductase family protein [Kiritimatiellaceae bacterium]